MFAFGAHDFTLDNAEFTNINYGLTDSVVITEDTDKKSKINFDVNIDLGCIFGFAHYPLSSIPILYPIKTSTSKFNTI